MSAPVESTIASSPMNPWPPRRIGMVAVQLLAILIATYAVFRFGALWTLRQFSEAQRIPGPNPFLVNFPRYTVATLWPIVGAVLLFLAAREFGRRSPRWWVLLVAAGIWFLAYLLVRPAQVYYYFLTPTS